MNAMREQFEQAARAKGINLTLATTGEYAFVAADHAWWAWQAAQRSALAMPVKRIELGHKMYLEFAPKTYGDSGWLLRNEDGGLIRALGLNEVFLVDAALAAQIKGE